MSMNLYQANKQWANRPDDERFQNINDLYEAVKSRRASSIERTVSIDEFSASYFDDERLTVAIGGGVVSQIEPTNWAFGQFAALAGAPAGYLRSLPAHLVAQCLNQSMKNRSVENYKALVMAGDNQDLITAATGPNYGRIWDADVVQAAMQIIDATGGKFYNPPAYKHGVIGGETEPAGLYASDRDVFMFFIDGGSLIDGGGERDQLHRGFFLWNSEVGKSTMGLMGFNFRAVCGNNIVWDATEEFNLRIRHTSLAPYKFAQEVTPALKQLTAASVKPFEEQIRSAKDYALPKETADLEKFATKFAITKGEMRKAVEYANTEEGQCVNLWDFVNGLTAYARDLAFADARIDLEKRAGSLMQIVKAA